MVDEKFGQDQLDLENLKKKLGADEAIEVANIVSKKIELLPDDDVADLSPMGVDAGTTSDTVPKAACMVCEFIGPYKQEDKHLKAKKDKRKAVTFLIMRMSECGHGIVYGMRNASVDDAATDAKKFQKRFLTLVKAKDQSGAQRSYRKYEKAIERVKARQKAAWKTNQNRIDLDAIPELANAT